MTFVKLKYIIASISLVIISGLFSLSDAQVSDRGINQTVSKIGYAEISFKKAITRGEKRLFYVGGGDNSAGALVASRASFECAAKVRAEFGVILISTKRRQTLKPNDVVSAEAFYLNDFFDAYKNGVRHLCPSVEEISFVGEVKESYGSTLVLPYFGSVAATSGWMLQEGAASGLSEADRVVKMRYRNWDNSVEVIADGTCSNLPYISLSKLSQMTLTKKPSLAAYDQAAATASKAYFKQCTRAEEVVFRLGYIPDNVTCGREKKCEIKVFRNKPDDFDYGVIKRVEGATRGIPPGGFRTLSPEEVRLEKEGVFNGVPAGLYFSALEDGSLNVARDLDSVFNAPYKAAMSGLDLKGSLIETSLASYLMAYDTRYKACLKPNAANFSVRTEWQKVTTVGGVEMSRGPVQGGITRYRVNPEFAPVMRTLATSSPEALGMVDSIVQAFGIWGRSGEMSIGNANRGVSEIMSQYACDSPEVKALEANMLAYWRQRHG